MTEGLFNDYPEGTELRGYARVLTKRDLGGLAFWVVRFHEENIQFVLRRDILANYGQTKKILSGSIVYIRGEKFITKTGEHSLLIQELEEVIPCDWNMPEKFHGLSQPLRYKQRVVDLICNEEAFSFFKAIANILSGIRTYLYSCGYKEFNTGILQEGFEAGQAEPFITQCRSTGKIHYLSLTSELKLKRLLVAGFEKVFEIAQSFRNEGIDSMHSPEFSLLEAYALGQSCGNMMEIMEGMVRAAVLKVFGKNTIPLTNEEGQKIETFFDSPFIRLAFFEAFKRYVDSVANCNLGFLTERFPDMFWPGMAKFTWVMKVIEKFIVPRIIQPTFLTDLPVGLSPFVRSREDNPEITDRAFFIAHGFFIADLYTDENDYGKVKASLEEQARETGKIVNSDYLEILRYGLPQTAGIGMGLNRFYMVFLGNLPKNIKETILYPIC